MDDGLGNDEVGNDELERRMHGRRRVGMILEECLNVMSDLLKNNGDGNGLERDEYRELEVYGREDEGMAEESRVVVSRAHYEVLFASFCC